MKIYFLPILFALVNISAGNGHNIIQEFIWPETPASKVAQDFVAAYNSGTPKELETFVLKHYNYTKSDQTELDQNVEEWMDLFHRYGPIKPHSISINKKHDLEVWMECTITKNWFAPEFILNEQTLKVRATGLLEGEQPSGVTRPAKDEDELLDIIENYLSENVEADLFQGVVLLQKDQGTIFHKAYGSYNEKQEINNSLDTRMRISSITKPITVIACLQLIQNGYLEFDKPISNYLPELPLRISDQISIRSLIMHTSGYELDGIPGFREELENTNGMQEVYEVQLKYLPKWEYYKTFDPKGVYDYSNDSFDLLAIIIEKVTGMAFQDYLETFIFKVANMTHTSYANDNVATPYRYDLKQGGLTDYTSYYPYSLGKISGAAGLKSTAEDLGKLFNTLYYSNELLSTPLKGLMFSLLSQSHSATDPDIGPSPLSNIDSEFKSTPKVKNGRSMGFRINYDTNLSYGHNGTSIGNSAELRFFPHSGHLMIVLCNNRSGAQNFFRFFNNHLPKQ